MRVSFELRRLREHATGVDRTDRLGRGVFAMPVTTRRARIDKQTRREGEPRHLSEHGGGVPSVLSEPVRPRRAKTRAKERVLQDRTPRVHSVRYQANVPAYLGPPGSHATDRDDERIFVAPGECLATPVPV